VQNFQNFTANFGLKWYEHFQKRFVLFYTISFLVIYSTIAILANLNYSRINLYKQDIIIDRYKRLVSGLIIEDALKPEADITASSLTTMVPQPPAPIPQSPAARQSRREAIDAQMARQGILQPTAALNPYGYLPDMEGIGSTRSLPEPAVVELSRRSTYRRVQGRSYQGVTNYNANEFDQPLTDLYNYVIRRQGNAYIKLTPELLKEDRVELGYRDPDEIQRVISRHQPMIEYCYRKGLALDVGLSGYVQVEFHISYEGFVIPESIRILGSTVRNQNVAQCIKNYIKRWRNFERLDESMGIARVTQKFVFN